MTGTAASPLSFGAGPIADTVTDHIRASFASEGSPGEPTLVVGVFGEWGSGKSTMLKAVQERLASDLKKAQEETFPAAYTVPVWFNAWRYEREEHLIVPMLKTAKLDVEAAFKRAMTESETFAAAAHAKLELLADLIIAGAGVIEAAVTLPGGVKIKPTGPWEWFKQFRARRKERADEQKSEIERLRSVQYEFLGHLKAITGRNPELFKAQIKRLHDRAATADAWILDDKHENWKRVLGFQLNLVFLIDDLDRCLPDKAVEVLEAIKLFLEVPGCAFVLALDDEIIERGIAYRYRDYLLRGRRLAASAPITGAEYLEKIVQLPVRLTRPRKPQITDFLRLRYADWFAAPAQPAAPLRVVSDEEKGAAPRTTGRAETAVQGPSPQERLTELVVSIVPAVPRKLVRTVDLMKAYEDILLGRAIKPDRSLLAILVTLQLFAPGLYRFLRIRGADLLLVMAEWAAKGELEDLEALAKVLESEVTTKKSEAGGVLRESKARLPALIGEVQDNRVGFDLRNVLAQLGALGPPGGDVAGALQSYFVLFSDTAASVTVAQPRAAVAEAAGLGAAVAPPLAQAAATAASGWIAAAEAAKRHAPNPCARPFAQLEDPRSFLDGILSNDKDAWRNALTREAPALAGRWLPDDVVHQLRLRLPEAMRAMSTSGPGIIDWLRTIGPHLSPAQSAGIAAVAASNAVAGRPA